MNQTAFPAAGIVLALFLVWNLAAFIVTGRDKRIARANGGRSPEQRRRRTPEKIFLLFAAAFAGAGVLCAFYAFRHKTKHYGLLFGVWALTLLTYGGAAAIWLFRDKISALFAV